MVCPLVYNTRLLLKIHKLTARTHCAVLQTKPKAPPSAPSASPGGGAPEPPRREKSRGQILINRLSEGVYDTVSDIGWHVGRQLRPDPTNDRALDSLSRAGEPIVDRDDIITYHKSL